MNEKYKNFENFYFGRILVKFSYDNWHYNRDQLNEIAKFNIKKVAQKTGRFIKFLRKVTNEQRIKKLSQES